jgi:hypothetical protein
MGVPGTAGERRSCSAFFAVPVLAIPMLREWGLKPWSLINLGPMLAVQPAGEEGALYNAAEWLLESVNGEIVISSRAGRCCAIQRLSTGLHGEVSRNARGEMRLHLMS